MADLINNDTPVAFFAHPRKLASPGRQLIDGVLSGCALDRLLRLIQKHNHRCGGFRYPSSGDAVWILAVLRHPPARRDFLQLTRVSPDSFRSDEDCARALSVGWMIGNLATRLDAQFNKWFGPFCHERHMAQTLHAMGADYEEDARRHVWKAMAHLEAAWSADDIVRYAGWWLEMEFSGLRAPRLVAELVSDALGLTPRMKERRARYLCGW